MSSKFKTTTFVIVAILTFCLFFGGMLFLILKETERDDGYYDKSDAVVDVIEIDKLAFDFNDENMTASVKMKDTKTTAGDIEVPMYVKNEDKVYKVTSVAEKGFGDATEGCSALTSITLPNSIEILDRYAFSSCTNLTKISLSSRLKVIDYGAFNCTKINEIVIPKSVTTIGTYAFRKCSNLENISFSAGLLTIDSYAFYGCSSLKDIALPQGLESLGDYAFRNCENLENIYLSDTVLEIGGFCFYETPNLKYKTENNIQYLGTKNNPYYLAVSAVDASATTYSLNKNCKVLGMNVFYQNQSVEEVTLPEGLKGISLHSFDRCLNLTTVNIPSSVVFIGTTAFQRCEKLTSEMIIPEGVTEIKKYTFYRCSKIPKITLHDNINFIGEYAFNNCNIAQINKIPSKVTQIGFCAFQMCYGLQDVTLPTNLEYIGDYALNHCHSATNTTLTIPSTIKQIGGATYDPQNPDLNVIGTHVFYDMATTTLTEFKMQENENFCVVDGALYRKDEQGNPSILIAYPPANTDSVYEMPDTVVNGFELSMSRPFYLKEIVLSDNFVIYKNENALNVGWGNNLAVMIYHYTSVSKITCKDTNNNYISYNGGVYSKDGSILYFQPYLSGLNVNDEKQAVLTFKEGVTTFFYGSLACSESDYKNNQNASQNTNEANQIKRYDKIIIPASVTNIDDSVIANINKQSWEIVIEEGNTIYKVVDGKIALV